jgi:hypothetical protein
LLSQGETKVAKNKRSDDEGKQVIGFVGLGLDAADGHQRLTRSEHFVLLGGSEETHAHMQDTAIRFDESLKKRGKKLADAEPEEALELLRKAIRK